MGDAAVTGNAGAVEVEVEVAVEVVVEVAVEVVDRKVWV